MPIAQSYRFNCTASGDNEIVFDQKTQSILYDAVTQVPIPVDLPRIAVYMLDVEKPAFLEIDITFTFNNTVASYDKNDHIGQVEGEAIIAMTDMTKGANIKVNLDKSLVSNQLTFAEQMWLTKNSYSAFVNVENMEPTQIFENRPSHLANIYFVQLEQFQV